jgi:hypothetical protein
LYHRCQQPISCFDRLDDGSDRLDDQLDVH